MKRALTLTVNGVPVSTSTSSNRTLLQLVREELGLIGTSEGCGGGDCGACAMLVDGQRTLACVTQADCVQRKSVTTIEGIAGDQMLRPAYDAFMENPAFPCGICGPGMLLSLIAHLDNQPDLTDATLISLMSANTCNCCGYPRIHAAVKRAASAYRATRRERGGLQQSIQ